MKPLSHYTGERLYRALLPLKRSRWLTRSYATFRYLVHILGNSLPQVFLRRLRKRDRILRQQAVLTHDTTIPELGTCGHILRYLADQGVHCEQGAHTVYLPPQSGLEDALGSFVGSYPPDAGFKIVKNMDAADQGQYLNRDSARRRPWVARVLAGSLRDLLDAACALELLGLGPRIYDLAELRNGSMRLMCYVVQHAPDGTPDLEAWGAFMRELKDAMAAGMLSLVPPAGTDHGDFQPPHCNHNLVRAENGRCWYVDFQSFIVKDRSKLLGLTLEEGVEHLHFGDRHRLTGKQFLYQGIPGLRRAAKRDTVKRWAAIAAALDAARVELKDRLVLDICCNSAMMLANALSNGAFWGLGWDMPEVAARAKQIQLALGNTRVGLKGCRLDEGYPLRTDIPRHLHSRLDGSVVFYLAAWRHVGFLRELADIPWKALVFEGHASDRDADTQENTERMAREWHCQPVHSQTIQDGHCGPRPLVVFVRRRA